MKTFATEKQMIKPDTSTTVATGKERMRWLKSTQHQGKHRTHNGAKQHDADQALQLSMQPAQNVLHTLRSQYETAHALADQNSPLMPQAHFTRAIARMTNVVAWDPEFPPLLMISGMN